MLSSVDKIKVIYHHHFSAPCREYTLLTESWRHINGFGPSSQRVKRYRCDTPRPTQGEPGIKEGWHRFSGDAGTHLPTSSLNNGAGDKEVCGTSFVAWMEGSHPTVYEGIGKVRYQLDTAKTYPLGGAPKLLKDYSGTLFVEIRPFCSLWSRWCILSFLFLFGPY